MWDDDDELPEDEEEMLVYVEFDGSVASNTFSNEKLHLDVIGLDMEHPIMQVNGKFYEGTYHDAVGTCMFFEKDNNPAIDDPVFDAIPTLKYSNKTRKILKMQRIFVEPKTEMLGDSKDPDCVPNLETVAKAGIPPRYQNVALDAWQKLRDDRMKALNNYLEKQRVRVELRSQGIEPDSDSDDDNPFAMYKPGAKQKRHKEENGSNVMSEQKQNDDEKPIPNERPIEQDDFNTSSIIDPGPSTSKNSRPWNSPPLEDHQGQAYISDSENDHTYHINLPNVTGKHKATVKVTKKVLVRNPVKGSKKKAPKEKKSGKKTNLDASLNPEKPVQTDLSRGIVQVNPQEAKETKSIDEPIERLESSESLSIDKTTEKSTKNQQNNQIIDEPESKVDKDKLERQRKRDEKMRLITERLKKAADELRIRTQQQTEDGV